MFQKLIRAIYNWSNSKVNWAKGGEVQSVDCSPGSSNDQNLGRTETPFNFVVYNANGGKIIQCWHYDKSTDRLKGNLYIIHSDDDFGEEISMIITKESLSR